jgi:hypothetical protein
MNPAPEVLLWGNRVFIRITDGAYSEGLLWRVSSIGDE